MTPLENIYAAVGELAYCMASIDGKVQRIEAVKFLDIVTRELANHQAGFDLAQITFDLMSRKKPDIEIAYNRAMHYIKLNKRYLSPALKEKLVKVLEEVAKAWPPVKQEEAIILECFKMDLELLQGDPEFYDAA